MTEPRVPTPGPDVITHDQLGRQKLCCFCRQPIGWHKVMRAMVDFPACAERHECGAFHERRQRRRDARRAG